MIFKIKENKDNFLEKSYKKAMKELNSFYGINWVHHCPNVFIVEDRKSIDALRYKNTEPWVVGWVENRDVYMMDFKKMGKESERKYQDKEYYSLVKHELSHAFFKILSGGTPFPSWLWEGVAIYTSGQNKFKKKPKQFSNFLSFWNNWSQEMYGESGFVVEILVKNFDKEKLLELIKSLKLVKDQQGFDKIFQKIYGFKLSYKKLNELA